jgi:hypothetical protein
MNHGRTHVLLLYALFASTMSGCESKWATIQDDTPWAGPQTRAIPERRAQRFIAEHPEYEYRWIATDGQVFDVREVAIQAGSFLLGTAAGRQLNPHSPPWFTIVSITPVVVLIVPTNLAQVPLGDLLGSHQPEELPMNVSPDGAGFRAEHGTITFYNPGIRWFSPDLKKPPTDLVFSAEGVAEISLPDGKLEIRHIGQTCKIARK